MFSKSEGAGTWRWLSFRSDPVACPSLALLKQINPNQKSNQSVFGRVLSSVSRRDLMAKGSKRHIFSEREMDFQGGKGGDGLGLEGIWAVVAG